MKKITIVLIITCLTGFISLYAQNEWKSQNSSTTQDLLSVHFPNRLMGWAVGENGTIVHSSNGGNTWAAQSSGLVSPLNDVFFATEKKGWIVGDQGKILFTNNSGSTWTTQASGSGEKLTAVFFADTLKGWIVGTNGAILYTNDAGTSWTPQSSAAIPSSNDLCFVNAAKGWVVANNGRIIYTNDGGTNWVTQSSGTSFNLMGVSFTDALNGWAVGVGGTILRTKDGGNTWSSMTSGTIDALLSVHFTDTLNGYAVGVSGQILKTQDGGTNWQTQNSGLTSNLRHVYFYKSNPGWICGNQGKILNLKSAEDICMVTIDTATYKYKIIWEQMPGQGTSYYNIYKLSGTNYVNIGTVPYTELSEFIDKNSKIENKPERYRISSVDSFSNESVPSPYHEIMFLQASQGTPATSVNVSWNKYMDESGAFIPEWYYIYRGTSPSGMYMLDSVSGAGTPVYTDNNVLSVYYYRVVYFKDIPCQSSSSRGSVKYGGPYSQSFSNIKEYATESVDYLDAYPGDNYIGNESEILTYSVFSNLSTWSVTSDESWAIIMNNDIANKTVTVAVGANSSGIAREAKIKFMGAGVPDRILTIYQSATSEITYPSAGIPFTLYPNPAGDYLRVDFGRQINGSGHIEILDQLGRVVLREKWNQSEVQVLDISALERGVYVVRTDKGYMSYKKFIKL